MVAAVTWKKLGVESRSRPSAVIPTANDCNLKKGSSWLNGRCHRKTAWRLLLRGEIHKLLRHVQRCMVARFHLSSGDWLSRLLWNLHSTAPEVSLCQRHQIIKGTRSQVLYLYSAFNNTNCVKATAQYQNRKIVYH